MKETSRVLSIIRAMIIDQMYQNSKHIFKAECLQDVCWYEASAIIYILGEQNCPTIVLYLWILGNSKRIGNSIPED